MSELVTYYIDGQNLREMGIYVSKSKGLLNRPSMKDRTTVDYQNFHGIFWNHNNKRLKEREITLSCFIKAPNIDVFIENLQKFQRLFDEEGQRELRLEISETMKPLVYMVECKQEINVDKTWNKDEMIGTFDLRLIESEPLKRLLSFEIDSDNYTLDINLRTEEPVTIYWGDGAVSYDVMSNGIQASDRAYNNNTVTISHTYKRPINKGTKYIVITGNIDEIDRDSFITDATILWDRY